LSSHFLRRKTVAKIIIKIDRHMLMTVSVRPKWTWWGLLGFCLITIHQNDRNGQKRVSIKATSDMSVTWDDRNESAMIQRSKRFLYAYTYIYTYTYVFIYSLINRKHIRCQVSELKAFTLDHVLTTTTISTWPAWRNRTPLGVGTTQSRTRTIPNNRSITIYLGP